MRRFVLVLIAIFFLPLTAAAQTRWQPELRVGLFSAPTVTLNFSLPVRIEGITIDANKNVTVSIADNKIKIGDAIINGTEIELRPNDDALIREMTVAINDKKYPGTVKLLLKSGNLTVINLTTTDEYLRGVVPNEMPTSWNAEALKVQTIAARTFALKNRKRHAAEGYDLCSTTHCQMYGDLTTAVERSDKAIAATFGEVLVFNDVLINAPFHSDSGGRTENASEVWGTHFPYLVSVDEFDNKTYPWNKKIPVAEFTSALGKDIGELQSIKLSALEIGKGAADRSPSGRVKFLIVVGNKGEAKITGADMRSKFKLRSTLFDVKLLDGEIEISGYGFGHGVGMSQYGTMDYADNGYNYVDILLHYYTGTNIKKLYGFLPAWTKSQP